MAREIAHEAGGFCNPGKRKMARIAVEALQLVGYDVNCLAVLIRADLPQGYRGMSWEDGAVLGAEAFSSQAMLNHVLEEEFLHLVQRARGLFSEFGPGTAKSLEDEVDAERKFPLPDAGTQ